MSVFGEDRNHAPTPERIKRFRKTGDYAYSSELATAIHLVAGVLALWFCMSSIAAGLKSIARETWSTASISVDPAMAEHSQSLIWLLVRLLLPMLIAISVTGMLAHTVQSRFFVKFPKPTLEKVTGQAWLKRTFSMASLGQIAMSFPKLIFALAAGAAAIWYQREAFFSLGGQPTDVMSGSTFRLAAIVGITVALTLLACSCFDFATRWFSWQHRLRMTDQELRDEMRGQTGDPQVERIRHQQMREFRN